MKQVFNEKGDQGDNLRVETFIRNTQYSKNIQVSILLRILMAFGVDIKNGAKSVISMENYVSIICFLKYHSFRGSRLVDIWMKIINP